MAERKYTHGLGVSIRNGVSVVSIGDMEIWDGADLSLIRDALFALVHRDQCSAIGVDMRFVQYVPSGFFGMLFDWFDQGIQVSLFHPRQRVRNMLWFRKFFSPHGGDGTFRLHHGMRVNEDHGEELWALSDATDADDPLAAVAG